MTSVGIGTMEYGGWGVNVFKYVKNNGIVSEAMLPVTNTDVSPAWAALSQPIGKARLGSSRAIKQVSRPTQLRPASMP